MQEPKRFKRFLFWLRESKFIRKLILYIAVFLLLWTIFLLIREPVIGWMKENRYVWEAYTHISHQIQNRTYLGLYYAGAVGSLAFVTLPAEIVSIFYFKGPYNPFLVIGICVLGILTGLIIDYMIGRVIGTRLLKYLLKDKYNPLENKIDRFGGWILLGLSLILSPIDLFSLVYGAMKYSFRKFFWIILVGQSMKFVVIYLFFDYLTKNFSSLIT